MSSSTASSPTSPTRAAPAETPIQVGPWENKLQEVCEAQRIPTPEFRFLSDRRGGRTAWSVQAIVQGVVISARYWYDGQFINNAKEDAAEVALKLIQNSLSQLPQMIPQAQQVVPYSMQFGASS